MRPALQATIARYRNGSFVEKADDLAAEEPLEIRIEGQSVAVLMRTPGTIANWPPAFLLLKISFSPRTNFLRLQFAVKMPQVPTKPMLLTSH